MRGPRRGKSSCVRRVSGPPTIVPTVTHYIYATSGKAVGFVQGRYVHALNGNTVGQLRGTHVHRLNGPYVGELYENQVVDKNMGNLGNIGNPGNPGSPGSPGDPGNRGNRGCPYRDVFDDLL